MAARTETERRRHERVAVALPAAVERIGGRPASAPGAPLDLSEGGAKVDLGDPSAGFAVGDVVRLTVDGGGGLSVAHQGLVVGASPAGVLNVAFKSLDEDAVVDLRRLLDLA